MKWSLEIPFFIEENKLAMKLTRYIPLLPAQAGMENVKVPAHWAGLPGNEISFLIVPLDPAYKAGLAGHLPVTYFEHAEIEKGAFHLACSLEVPKIEAEFVNEQV